MRLVSINIGGYQFLNSVIPWLQSVRADVVCVQEIFEGTLQMFARALEMEHYAFTAQAFVCNCLVGEGPDGNWGIATFSRTPLETNVDFHYAGVTDIVTLGDPWHHARRLLLSTMRLGKNQFRLANIHAPYNVGEVTEQQRVGAQRVIQHLREPSIPTILCGDFNAPRGEEVMQIYYQHGDSVVPDQCTRTLDPMLHRKPELCLVVDDVLIPPGITVHRVDIQFGVSDHAGIIVDLSVGNTSN